MYKKNNKKNYFLVSNKHVMSGCNQFSFSVPMSSVGENTKIVTYSFEAKPILHPEYDLALIKFNNIIEDAENNNYNMHIKYITPDDTMSEDIKVSPIEAVYISGYPGALVGDKYKCPIIKHGITATPLTSEYNDRQEFLTDIISINGYSGSPVFLEKNNQLLLSGIHYSSLTKNDIEVGLSVTINYKIIRQFLSI